MLIIGRLPLILFGSGPTQAAGYKIPEQSLNSTALSAAYVANAHGADASYNNPAAMAFNEGGRALEADLTLIHLTRIQHDGASFDDRSQVENFQMPTLHYVSDDKGGWRYGFSMVSPAGLSKRWEGTAAAFAEEFTLQTLELNPTIGFQVNDRFAVGGSVRAVYSKGKVISSDSALGSFPLGRSLEGDSFDFGYNLALHYRASKQLDLSATYRSKVELTLDGDARLTYSGTPYYNSGASVTVPIPAALNLAAAYTFDRTTLELVLERTYWSASLVSGEIIK